MAFLLPLAAAGASALGGAAAAVGTAATGFSLGTALTVGGTLLSAFGTVAAGQAQKKASDYNAKVQQQEAVQAENVAATKATEISTRTKQRSAATRAGSLQNGLELSGSVNDVLDTVQQQGTLDELTALYDGSARAQGLRASAELERAKGKSAVTASYIGAGSSLLTGFSKGYYGADTRLGG